jgi:hypothetical protein
MKIRHLLENRAEFFWESMQDAGWKPDGDLLVSPDDQRIVVARGRLMYYRGVDTGVYYTEANYAKLLSFDENAAEWYKKNQELLNFAPEAVQLVAVRRDWFAIQHIKNPSEAVKLAAVQQNGFAFQYIVDPSEEIKLAAVRQDGHAIRLIRNPSEAVKIAAVRQNGLMIHFIENPSEAVKRAAQR